MGALAMRIGVDTGPQVGTEVPLVPGHTLTIGRKTGLDLTLDGDEFVSPLHAEIVCAESALTLRNHSANGTLVNGRPIRETVLMPGDKIAIGLVHLLSVKAASPGASAARPGRVVEAAPVTAVPPLASRGPAGKEPRSSSRSVQRIPAWLKAYLVVMALAFAFFGLQRMQTSAPPGLAEIQRLEAQFASTHGLPAAETGRLLRLLEQAVVHERRGDRYSAYESYREALSVRQPINPRSPAYRYAAGRLADLGLK